MPAAHIVLLIVSALCFLASWPFRGNQVLWNGWVSLGFLALVLSMFPW